MLLVDDDSVVEMFARAIRSLRLEVVSASEGRQALAIAHRVRFNLLLLHVALRDIPGLELVRALHRQGCKIPFIVTAGSPTEAVAAEARALGALSLLEEPIHLSELRAAVAHAVGLTEADSPASMTEPPSDEHIGEVYVHSLSPIRESHTACERWCNFVIELATSEYDLGTNGECAKYLGVCQSVFSELCRLVDVTAENTRNFSRGLRAIDLLKGRDWIPEMVLAIDDGRTLKRFEERSGVKRWRNVRGHKTRTPTIEEFLERQEWLPHDNPAVLVFQRLLMETRR